MKPRVTVHFSSCNILSLAAAHAVQTALTQRAGRKGTAVIQPGKEVNQDLVLALSPAVLSDWTCSRSLSAPSSRAANQDEGHLLPTSLSVPPGYVTPLLHASLGVQAAAPLFPTTTPKPSWQGSFTPPPTCLQPQAPSTESSTRSKATTPNRGGDYTHP